MLGAQPKCYFEHYGAENGLPQHTIMGILQDKKGFMWFSTWDGLCKFDGYNFYSYKIQQQDAYHMRSNRIDHIMEDKFGCIWTLPYDKEVHRFDPRSESFMGLRSIDKYKDLTFTTNQIKPMKYGCCRIRWDAYVSPIRLFEMLIFTIPIMVKYLAIMYILFAKIRRELHGY